ncbi:MAG: Asp-tRNA(Asn)/Glu-tRNA(Gln) amidotransferase subunit GatC [Caldiserica bacterium]|nr:Asp-tRNA(Asn)/Glu-tRNA(Gln) amidotransferase subunit GatC [Caldisericota bacterium]
MRRLEELAGFELSPEEREALRSDLARILSYFRKLQELDTEGVPPYEPLPGVRNILREDEPHESLPREEALANAPRRDDGYFAVPRVFGEP